MTETRDFQCRHSRLSQPLVGMREEAAKVTLPFAQI